MTQIGTVKLQTQNSGVVDVPVFETGDSASGVFEFVRVETASGTGFIPVTDPADATYPYLRVQSQNNGIVAVTDTAGDDIPDDVVDNFEDADGDPPGPYEDGDTLSTFYTIINADFDRTTTDVIKGGHSLSRESEPGSADQDVIISQPNDGLPNYPDEGETLSLIVSDVARDMQGGVLAAVPDDNDFKGYGISPTSDTFRLWRFDGVGDVTELAQFSDTSSGPLEVVISPPADGEDSVEGAVYELDSDLERDGELGSFDETDDTYAGERGVGVYARSSGDTGTFADELRRGRSL